MGSVSFNVVLSNIKDVVKLVFCGNVVQTLLNHKMTEMGVQNSKNKIGSNFLIIKHLTGALPISLS